MKKNTLYLIIAIISLYIAWRTFRINKDIRDTQKSMAQPETEPADPNEVPETPLNRNKVPRPKQGGTAPAVIITADEREKVVVTTEDCPFCGTRNAEIRRTYRDGVLVETEVVCPNKSCPGPTGGNVQVINSIKSNKFVVTR